MWNLTPATSSSTCVMEDFWNNFDSLKCPPGRSLLAYESWLLCHKIAIWISKYYGYLLTPWCRVLLEKLTGLRLVKKFPAFYGTRRYITVLTSVRHLSLSWANPIQSTYPHPTSWRSIQILSTHLRLGLPSGLFLSRFPTKTLYAPLSSPILATCPAHLILLDFITRTILGEEYISFSSSLCSLLHSPVTSSLLGPNILLNTIFKILWLTVKIAKYAPTINLLFKTLSVSLSSLYIALAVEEFPLNPNRPLTNVLLSIRCWYNLAYINFSKIFYK